MRLESPRTGCVQTSTVGCEGKGLALKFSERIQLSDPVAELSLECGSWVNTGAVWEGRVASCERAGGDSGAWWWGGDGLEHC